MLGLVRAIVRLFLLAVMTILVVGFQHILFIFHRGKFSYIVPQWWQSGARCILGVKVVLEGKPCHKSQALYVGNHLSYIDIPLVGSFVRGSFVARGDLSGWPLLGQMALAQQTVFISRKREDAVAGKDALETVLKGGKSIIVFAEGTSSDGSRILPFKSSLFTLALNNPGGRPLMVQPFTISLLSVHGVPADTQSVRDQYAWYGDMTLPPHMWAFLKGKGAVVKLTFHKPRDAAEYTDRKTLCQDCYNDVVSGLVTDGLAKSA